MEFVKNKQRNEMTFPELWEDLRKAEVARLKLNIMNGVRKNKTTFWRWCKGDKTPQSFAEKSLVAEIVNQTLGISTDADTLFPATRHQ